MDKHWLFAFGFLAISAGALAPERLSQPNHRNFYHAASAGARVMFVTDVDVIARTQEPGVSMQRNDIRPVHCACVFVHAVA
jgi:hypothetical protein